MEEFFFKSEYGANPSSTTNPKYPNSGVKTPSAMMDAPRQKGKMKIRKPKSRVQNGNGADASGAFSSSATAISSVYKAKGIVEGDFVRGMTTEGMVVGLVEHVMTEGGVYGVAGTEYAIQSTPENPAMAVRVYEEDDDMWEPTAYTIGMLMSNAEKIDPMEMEMQEDEMEELERLAKDSPCWDGYAQRGMKPGANGGMVPNCVPVQKYHEALMEKAETYSPTSGMKSAAARALRWKKDGKATGAGTAVGWGRATDIVAGRPMSLSVVKRMYSFFARHEVDKKGKDFYNTSNPSNGRIMWDAWGGDSGFTWSKAIATRAADKALFADFGKDYSTHEAVSLKADSVSVGQHVTFGVPKPPAATEMAHGEVERVERSGTVTIGNEKVEASADNPVAIVRVWAEKENGGYTKTDRRVAKPVSSLRVVGSDLKEASYDDEDMEMEKVSEPRLRELVEAYNKNKEGNSRITIGTLRQVYNRGVGAYRTNPGSVRGTVSSAEQWAMGRVNAFMAGLRGRFPRKPFDLDLFPSGHPRSTKGKPKEKSDSEIWQDSPFGRF